MVVVSKHFEILAKNATPLTEYIIQYLTKNNDLVNSEKKVKFLNDLKPIFEQIKASKLLLLFKKRIAEMINLDMDEIDQILEINKPYIKKSSNKVPNRLPMSPIRKFCLLLILRPDLIKQEDLKYFTSDKIDDKLVLAIMEMTKKGGLNNSAAIIHFLSSRFDAELIRQVHTQLATFDDEMEMEDEVKALRISIIKRHSLVTNKSKLNEATKKSLASLSEEEREFIKNIGKL